MNTCEQCNFADIVLTHYTSLLYIIVTFVINLHVLKTYLKVHKGDSYIKHIFNDIISIISAY